MHCGLVIVDELAQHRHEAVDGVGGSAVWPGQTAYRVVGAIHLIAAVDEEQGGFRQGGPKLSKSVYHLELWLSGSALASCWSCCACAACQKLGLVKQYEYDERVELSLDGSAVVDINASVPALVALRGATLDVDPEARFDRQAFRRLYEGAGRHGSRGERVPPARTSFRARAGST